MVRDQEGTTVHFPIDPFRLGNRLLNALVAFCVKASANIYSLIETAKASGLEPYAYLRKVFSEIPNAVTVDDFEALLPWNVQKISEKSKSP
ncbi:MAG: transposase domain-containing protein [Nitrospirae bacterium]|nr:transposase domain-containing protein [Magnetococcales bacterium]